MEDTDLSVDIEESEETEEQSPDNEILEKAKSMGYNPDYDGDNKVSAEEFVARKPLYDSQRKLKRRIRDLETTVTKQREISNRLLQAQKEELLGQLEEQKRAAIADADAVKVVEVDKKIAEANQAYATTVAQSAPGVPDSDYQSFLDNNSWYEDDADMQAWAHGVAADFAKSNPQGSKKALLDKIATDVKKVFPHKFHRETKTSEVMEPSRGGQRGSSGDLGWEDIPKGLHRTIAVEQWKSGAFVDKNGKVLPKKEAMKVYANELKKIGEIE